MNALDLARAREAMELLRSLSEPHNEVADAILLLAWVEERMVRFGERKP